MSIFRHILNAIFHRGQQPCCRCGRMVPPRRIELSRPDLRKLLGSDVMHVHLCPHHAHGWEETMLAATELRGQWSNLDDALATISDPFPHPRPCRCCGVFTRGRLLLVLDEWYEGVGVRPGEWARAEAVVVVMCDQHSATAAARVVSADEGLFLIPLESSLGGPA